MALKDQRTMSGRRRHRTVADVEAYWYAFSQRPEWQFWAARGGEAMFDPALADRSAVSLDAYANHGRWIADCPCGGGVACWSANTRGACLDCGTIWGISFPSAKDVIAAEEILAQRAQVNRNWRPHQGEPIGFLALENAENGLIVPDRVRDVAEQLGLATILEAREQRLAAGA